MIEQTCQDHEHRPEDSIFTRRQFLNRLGMGFGALSLTSLVGMGLLEPPDVRGEDFSPLAPRAPQFTPRAKRVLELSLLESRQLGHRYIGTEDILLGLIREGEGVAARALDSLGISLHAVRLGTEEIIGRGQHAQEGHIPFTPRAKRVLELALLESRQLGHRYIGTEHILLGLIREGEGVAAQVLTRLGADLHLVREQVIQLLADHARRAAETIDSPEPE